MGSGKSTVGPILANTIGYQFIDLDTLIEEKVGMRIGEIFEKEGEQKFREIERESLRKLLDTELTVISLGGGSVTNAETLELVKKSGLMIYLKSDPPHIFQRLRTKGDRPMLRDEKGNLLDGAELMKKIETLLNARKHFYEQADVIISTDDKKIGHTIDELAKKLTNHLG